MSSEASNRNTIFSRKVGPASETKLERAWDIARKTLINIPKPSVPGYALFWTNGRSLSFGHLACGSGNYVIVGRHTNCDVILGMDPTLSLRHLLARSLYLADGTLALRLLDLKTNLPFFLDDGIPRRSIMASGPVLVRVGDYVLGGIPTDPFELKALGQGPYRSRPAPLIRQSQEIPKFSERTPGRASVITVFPPLPTLGELPAGTPADASQHRLSISNGYLTNSFWLGSSELDAGVLIGRADKCIEMGLSGLLDQNISRAHVLLLRENEGCSVFDLCSTQGIYSIYGRTRYVEVPAEGTMVTLGKTNPVDLWWQPPRLGSDPK